MRRQTSAGHRLAQNGELYDAGDFRLALLELNRLGYDIKIEQSHTSIHRLNLTCGKTRNRFVVECIGHKDWL